ncbi:MAG: hypothetical protein KC519_12475, partial [Anaerolineae bacterium]|nr:hypothetical protein [Anaerolineae bacterium]
MMLRQVALWALVAWAVLAFVPVRGQDQPQAADAAIAGVTQTHQRQDGNRIVAGTGTFPNVQMREVALGQAATWLVGVPQGDGAQWYAALADGRVLVIGDEGPEALAIQLAPGQPFAVVAREDGTSEIVFTDGVQESALTSVTLLDNGTRLTITPAGEIVSDGMPGRITLPVAAPPDARIALSASGLAATYTQTSSDRYAHGILGDTLEGTHLLVLDADSLNVVADVALPPNDVFEGLMPLWADVDGDGAADLVTMVSNADVGTRLRIYRADGSVLAESAPIGRGFRWRHALAFA